MFVPSLCAGTKKMATRRATDQPSFEELYREADQIRKKKEAKLQEQIKKRDAAELKEATFKPKINANAGKKPDAIPFNSTQDSKVSAFEENTYLSLYGLDQPSPAKSR